VKLFLPIFKMNLPKIVDIALPAEGVFHNLVSVSIRKSYPMQAYKITKSYTPLGHGADDVHQIYRRPGRDVNVHNSSEVSSASAQRDSIFTKGPAKSPRQQTPRRRGKKITERRLQTLPATAHQDECRREGEVEGFSNP